MGSNPAIPTNLWGFWGSMVTKPWCMEVPRVQRCPLPLATVSRQSKRRILNASTLKALTPPPTGSIDHFDDLTPGLSLRITSNDVRTWTVFFRDKNGRQKRLTLGRFPAVTFADARDLARNAPWPRAGIPSPRSAPPARCSRSARSPSGTSRTTPSPTSGAGPKTSASSTQTCCRSGRIAPPPTSRRKTSWPCSTPTSRLAPPSPRIESARSCLGSTPPAPSNDSCCRT